jgi:hypothetical protein
MRTIPRRRKYVATSHTIVRRSHERWFPCWLRFESVYGRGNHVGNDGNGQARHELERQWFERFEFSELELELGRGYDHECECFERRDGAIRIRVGKRGA